MQEQDALSCSACGANCWPKESSDPALQSCRAPDKVAEIANILQLPSYGRRQAGLHLTACVSTVRLQI